MVAVLVPLVPLVLCGLVAVGLSAARRSPRASGSGRTRDAPELITTAAGALLGGSRAAWSAAMVGELDRIESRRKRWIFALGCLRTSVLAPPWRRAPGRPVALAVAGAAAAAAGLVGFGLVRYPGLVTGTGTWLALVAFLVVLAGYTVTGGVLAHVLARTSRPAVRSALLGVVVLAVGWLAVNVLLASDLTEYVVTLLMALVPLAAAFVGVAATWRARNARTGRQASGLLAVLAGLAVFVAWTGETVFDAGKPYDAGQLRDFAGSGAPDLATYAVSDNLGSAMMLLLLVPLVVLAIGSVTAALTERLCRQAPAALG